MLNCVVTCGTSELIGEGRVSAVCLQATSLYLREHSEGNHDDQKSQKVQFPRFLKTW